MLDVSAERGWLVTSIRITQVVQMVVQARWIYDHPLTMLPRFDQDLIRKLK